MVTEIISETELETLDLDWFASDPNGLIAHFASGGRGFVPSSVVTNRRATFLLAKYFRDSLPASSGAQPTPFLTKYIQFSSEAQLHRYLEDFVLMARKGLFSFDCMYDGVRPVSYFAVARPQTPVRLHDLPSDVAALVQATRFNRAFDCATELASLDVVVG